MNNKITKLSFVTTNNVKFDQVSQCFRELAPNILLEQVKIDLPEYQSLDINYVSREKAKEAFKQLGSPLIIDDGGIYLEAYNNFPGALSRYVFEGIGFEGIFKLAEDNPGAYFKTQLVYTDNGKDFQVFEGKLHGKIIKPEKPIITTSRMPFTLIFYPDGYYKPLKQLLEESKTQEFNHRYQSVKKLAEFLNK